MLKYVLLLLLLLLMKTSVELIHMNLELILNLDIIDKSDVL